MADAPHNNSSSPPKGDRSYILCPSKYAEEHCHVALRTRLSGLAYEAA